MLRQAACLSQYDFFNTFLFDSRVGKYVFSLLRNYCTNLCNNTNLIGKNENLTKCDNPKVILWSFLNVSDDF